MEATETEAVEMKEMVKVNMLHWKKVVALLQTAFHEGHLAEEATWQVVVMIPKRGGYYRGVVLVEVVWKVVMVTLNSQFTFSIAFHDVLHGLQAGRGTGTSTLKAKLLQQLTSIREEFLYVIFLDLNNPYDALDRKIFMNIMEGYNVETWTRHILRKYWYRLWMVARVRGYYWAGFKGLRGG